MGEKTDNKRTTNWAAATLCAILIIGFGGEPQWFDKNGIAIVRTEGENDILHLYRLK